MKRLSIIVPVYKVESCLERCLRSLEEQDIPKNEYEIVCINDGSPDNSRGIVLRLQQEFDNIILIDQENQGVSMARNKGVEKSTGKYLLFIDSDDFVKENSLGQILKEADSKNAQIVIPGYTYLDVKGNVQGEKIFEEHKDKVVSGIEAYKLSREKWQKVTGPPGGIIPDSSVGIIFEADFIKGNNLRYVQNITLNQDVELLARIHCLAERCIFVNHFLYIAAARLGSATRSNQFNTEKVRNGFVLAASNLKKFQNSPSLSAQQKLYLNGPVAQFALLAVYSGIRTRSVKILIKTVKHLQETGVGKIGLKGCKGYHKICGIPYNLSPYLGALASVIYLRIHTWHSSVFNN